MTEKELENAIVTYLNGDRFSVGFEPIKGKNRLAEKYGNQDEEIMGELNVFLSKFPEPDWKSQTYSEYLKQMEKYALDKFEWINPTLAKAISNYFAYEWR